jgi:hypothetical protein
MCPIRIHVTFPSRLTLISPQIAARHWPPFANSPPSVFAGWNLTRLPLRSNRIGPCEQTKAAPSLYRRYCQCGECIQYNVRFSGGLREAPHFRVGSRAPFERRPLIVRLSPYLLTEILHRRELAVCATCGLMQRSKYGSTQSPHQHEAGSTAGWRDRAPSPS